MNLNKFIGQVEVDNESLGPIEENFYEEPKQLYTVKVTHPSLRRRSAPNLQADVLGLIQDQGYYPIYEEVNGWGKLEDGSWIMLSYTQISY